MSDISYRLYYWPSIPGRGELVRLTLAEAGVDWIDVARLPKEQGGGSGAIVERMKRDDAGVVPPFAPPFVALVEDGVEQLLVAQTAVVLDLIARRHGLVPSDEATRASALQLQLTVADLIDEAHDSHHPIASGLYYEDQQSEAARRAADFVGTRLPKFLGYFERAIRARGGPFLLGAERCYADLSLFQVLGGLQYAYPRTMTRLLPTVPHLAALPARVAALPRIASYLASDRHVAFNQHGIFRHYPELDT
jgi:glutathione S-transferase